MKPLHTESLITQQTFPLDCHASLAMTKGQYLILALLCEFCASCGYLYFFKRARDSAFHLITLNLTLLSTTFDF